MKKVVPIVILFLLFFFHSVSFVQAQSDYVLPYPSIMPGSLFYRAHLLFEVVSRYWYFGDFGQFDYSLKESDKYLVEAKTLFEYNQYFLGLNALQKSDYFFKKTLPYLKDAQTNNKNISEKKIILRNAARKHKEVLLELEQKLPEKFIWQPEKSSPATLFLKEMMMDSIKIREVYE